MTERVLFDGPRLGRLKRAYEKAKLEKQETFVFEDHEYLVDYAKYLIEYLERATMS
jgi:hypothetical protein